MTHLYNPSSPTPWGPLGELVFRRTYARPNSDGSSETWNDLIRRFVRGANAAGAGFSSGEQDRLSHYMHQLKGTGAGRMLWTLGSPLQDALGSASCVNCWVASLDGPSDFHWMLMQLMTGGGVGYVCKPENAAHWPIVAGGNAEHSYDPDAWFVDDSREGWADAVETAIQAVLTGCTFRYNVLNVRPLGAPLRTFGGTASGPLPLIEGIADIVKVMQARTGKNLRPIDLSDMANIVARLVVAGSKRRSAQIALGSVEDTEYLAAKQWSDGDIPGWRSQANFSVDTPSIAKLPAQFWTPYEQPGSGEAFGLVNTENARLFGRSGQFMPDPDVIGFNPCGEAQLPKYGSCNLATIHLSNVADYDEFIDITKLLYRVQKAVATLPHPHKRTEEIMRRDSRLGLSVTGYLQATEDHRSWLFGAYDELRAYDREYSARRSLPESIRLTAIKPEGTVSKLSGTTAGGHAAWDDFYVQRIRFLHNDESIPALRAAGVPVVPDVNFDGSVKQGHLVTEFPIKTLPGTPTAVRQTAHEQMETSLRLQREWADQAVSITVTYRPEELPEIKSWLHENWHQMKTISFLPFSDHGFNLAPLESISEDEYTRRAAAIGTIHYTDSSTTMIDVGECAGDACPIR